MSADVSCCTVGRGEEYCVTVYLSSWKKTQGWAQCSGISALSSVTSG